MIFITGPLLAGKQRYIRETLGLSPDEFARRAVWDVQDLAAREPDLPALAEALSQREIVIATEMGGGVVPTDPEERADSVVRVCCGLPQVLKGTLPC